ncbi:hypothetical protein BH09PSE6_BH09PSE6_19060 [soil metagenome]
MNSRRQSGVVLPIVLVLLVVLTSLVLSQIRRGTVDQALSTNSRQYTLVESTAQSVLRWCESRALKGAASGLPDDWVRLVTNPGIAGDPGAWRDPNNWTNFGNTMTPEVLALFQNVNDSSGQAVASAQCLFEDASKTLRPPVNRGSRSLEGVSTGTGGGTGQLCPNTPIPNRCKLRITVRVQPSYVATDCNTVPRGCLYLQSEIRFSI